MDVEAFCEYPFNRCRVTAEGWVSFCCFMRPDPTTPPGAAYLGNLLHNSFDEVWFGERAEQVRHETLEGRLHELCRCPGCPYLGAARPYPRRHVVYNEYPTFLEVDLPNTHCNVGGLKPDPVTSPACVMCERASPHFVPEENHLFEVLEKLKCVVPNLSNIHVQGIAEPFYQTRQNGFLLFDVMDALEFEMHSQHITVGVTTNGTLLNRPVRDRYLKRFPDSITTFSIDAATPETFKRIRILDCFDKVVANLNDFSAERDPTRQFLQIHNNVNTLNVHEVAGMVGVAAEAGVDLVEFNPTNGHLREVLVGRDNCGLFARAQQDITQRCAELGVKCRFIRPLDLGMAGELVQITL